MFTKNDILARLKAGESAQDIAQNLADSLNDAIKAYEDEKRKAEEAELAKAKREAEKQAAMEDITKRLNDFFCKYYDDASLSDLDVSRFSREIIKMMDKASEAIAAALGPIGTDPEDDDEAVLRSFLENNF